MDLHTARALLEWQIELGADEAIEDAPVDRTALDPAPPRAAPAPPAMHATPTASPSMASPSMASPSMASPPLASPPLTSPPAQDDDPAAAARTAAAAATTLDALAAAMAAFEASPLRLGARSLVFADGDPAAPVMIVGEAPGRDEDVAGRPFVGRAGQLLDRMLSAIGLARAAPDPDRAVYITNVLPWRPPQNRTPDKVEIATFLPFLEAHVALADPAVLVLMGNTPCQALLGRAGITRLRGQWTTALGRPALPMYHPAYLLRSPHAKREAWADLLELQARLRELARQPGPTETA